MRPWQVKVTLYDIRACSAITNKIFFTGTNKVMQGKNGGKADESEISQTVTCDGHHSHPHSSPWYVSTPRVLLPRQEQTVLIVTGMHS